MANYWCFRIDNSQRDYINKELHYGNLRQGWGWDERQNLRDLKMDNGAKRNLSMLKVKKGDFILVPRIPNWGSVTIVQATEDWSKGYKFSIDEKVGDYGHIFPAKKIRNFTRKNENVSGNIRSTLRNPSRFWNINHYSSDVEKILNAEQDKLSSKLDHSSRMTSVIGDVFDSSFDEDKFAEDLYLKFNEQFTSEEWEFVLVEGLKVLYPFYTVERTGGKEEKNHGTDILVRIPSIVEGLEYGIAIQVKDYEGFVQTNVIDQINKADEYWGNENLKLIDKWVIITKASKDENNNLSSFDKTVKIIFAKEMKHLLSRIGKSIVSFN